MIPGHLYLLRGGHIVRHRDKHQGWGAEEVIREVTKADARMLRVRLVQLRVRRMVAEVAWIRKVMSEVGVEPTRIPARFTRTWAP